jgi:hypothetical protein
MAKAKQVRKAIKAVCVGCGQEKDCFSALPLKRESGKWKVDPICPDCRRELAAAAEARNSNGANVELALYGLEASLKEVERRNSHSVLNLGNLLDQAIKAKQPKA